VVDILSGLASAGVTVIITIHQPRPDVFNLMQRVLILSGDGRMVYSGTAACTHLFLGLRAEVFQHTPSLTHPCNHSNNHTTIHTASQPASHPSIHLSIHPIIHLPIASFVHHVSSPRVSH